MFRRGLALGGIALVCLIASAGAQSIAPLRFGVALGPSFGDREWWWPDGGHAALSLTSAPANSRFGLRVEGIVDHNTEGSHGDDGTQYLRQASTVALTINSTYRLTGRQTGLYAIGGIGVYQRWVETRTERFASEELRTFSHSSLDANLGLGYNFMAFGRELFVESRLFGTMFGDRVPVSVGIRF